MKAFSFEETDLFLPLRLGRTARETLQEFIDIDVRSEDLVRILNQNQVYRDLLFRFVSQKSGKVEAPKKAAEEKDPKADPKAATAPKEPPSPTFRTVSLLGMINTRNLILALRIRRLVDGRFPFNEEGNLDVTAADELKWAIEAEELFLRNNFEYPETAHAAGMYFDLCRALYSKNEETFKKVEPYFKRTWTRALRTACVAHLLAQRIPGVSPKAALSAGFLAHAGKMHMASWLQEDSPAYFEFEEQIDTNSDLPSIACLLLEKEKFGVTHEEIGSHSLRYFDIFKHLVPVVRNFREPYILAGADPTNYPLTLLIHLADNMARSWKLPASDTDPVIDSWKYPTLNLLKVTRTTLVEVMKKAMSLK